MLGGREVVRKELGCDELCRKRSPKFTRTFCQISHEENEMSQRLFALCIASLLTVAVGCGGKAEIGPADATQTPQVSQEEIHEKMRQGMQQGMQNMPAKQKQMMESKYKQGTSSTPAAPAAPTK
jgi:hypothetical protein